MSDNSQSQNSQNNQPKIINEGSYNYQPPQRQFGPAAVGKGGDPFFKRIRASKEQLSELLDETTIVQDWSQREACNNAALACLDNENLKEIYFQIKDGFGEYGPILLMGFKTPQGVEIPRLKLYNSNGDVIQVLSGPSAMEEINRRAIAFRESQYEVLPEQEEQIGTLEEYSPNTDI